MANVPGARIFNTELCFRLGVAYPMRTTSDISPRPLAPNCCFNKGAQLVPLSDKDTAAAFIALAYTRPFKLFVEAMYGGGDVSVSGSAAKNYTGGVLNGVPFPNLGGALTRQLSNLYHEIVAAIISLKTYDEESRFFRTSIDLPVSNRTLRELAATRLELRLERNVATGTKAKEVDELALEAYDFDESARAALRAAWGEHPYNYPQVDHNDIASDVLNDLHGLLRKMCAGQWSLDADVSGSRRLITKKGYFSNRMIEVFAHIYRIHPSSLVKEISSDPALLKTELHELTRNVMSYAIGCSLGRWNIQLAQRSSIPANLPGPFDPLPVQPPGMLSDTDEMVSERRSILVDDAGHESDVVRQIRYILSQFWGNQAEAIEQEACDILGARDLRDYFSRHTLFFADHLSQYSKSRRQAPIYWPLSTASGSYTLWLYYPRLTSDTLYTAVNRYVEPKIAQVGRELGEMEGERDRASGREAARLRERVEGVQAFRDELAAFRDELLRVAALPYRPDLNDGVIINAAPLHRLFRLPKWAKDTKECWAKLERGDYDWAHLAYTIWPDRVREKCRGDKSLAIAHGLEELYVELPATTRKRT